MTLFLDQTLLIVFLLWDSLLHVLPVLILRLFFVPFLHFLLSRRLVHGSL